MSFREKGANIADREQGKKGKILQGRREQDDVLGNTGATKPPQIFPEMGVDSGERR